jgi:hypothetical protein
MARTLPGVWVGGAGVDEAGCDVAGASAFCGVSLAASKLTCTPLAVRAA